MERTSYRLQIFLLTLLGGGSVGLTAESARASDIIPPGIHAKAGAGGGQTLSRGPAAIFINPANLIFAKHIEPSIDVSVAKLTYSYAHTDKEKYPAMVSFTSVAPSVTAGAGIRLIPNFAFGFAVSPTNIGAGKVVKGVPLYLPGVNTSRRNDGLVDLSIAESGIRIAGGLALKLADPFIVGAGVILTNETLRQFQVAYADEEPYFDLKNKGSSTQFIGGIRSELLDRRLAMALSVKTAVQKKYKGDYFYDTSDKPDSNIEFLPSESIEYLPMTIGFGLESKMGPFGVFLDFTREQWSNGRKIVRFGISDDPLVVDLIDTNNISTGIKLWPAESHMLMGSVGIHGANRGNGTEISPPTSPPQLRNLTMDEAPSDDAIGGMSFGDLQAIRRMIFAGGYRLRLSGHGYIELAAQMQTGKRTIPEGFPQQGDHTLQVFMGSAGLSFGF